MPTHTTITENLDGTFSVQVHDADALRRIQTMCDIIREDDDDDGIDAERALIAAYADDLYNVIGEALSADYKANSWRPGADRWDALTAWLSRNPASRPLPWEYMGHDEKGAAHYRERQHGNRLTLTPSGRLARIHTTTTIGQCPNCEPHHAPCTHCAAACHRCGRTDDLDTAPGRATTCHPCALDDDLSRHLAANHTT